MTERVRVFRAPGSSAAHVMLASGAIVCLEFSEPVPESFSGVSALKPVEAEVELGPYCISERQFKECKVCMVFPAIEEEPKTTKFKRVKK